MASPASVKRHPIHPMLVPLPIGLWIFSLVCDLVYLFGGRNTFWTDMAFYTMAGGIVGALMAAIPGLIDFLSLSEPRVRKIGATHMIINLIIVALFAGNLWLRMGSAPGASLPIGLSVVGIVLLLVSGWLGGELIYVHGVSVEPQHAPGERDRPKGRIA